LKATVPPTLALDVRLTAKISWMLFRHW